MLPLKLFFLNLKIGLSGALETLCGQGYGAKLYKMLGIYLQASFVSSLIISIAISILWFYAEPVLIFLGQDPKISKVAAVYLICLIPGLFAYAFLQCLLRFLQTQTVLLPLIAASVVPLILHVGLTYILVHWTSLGFKGSPLATSITLWVSCLMLACYVNYSGRFKLTWQGFSTECFQYIFPYLKLAIPSTFMVCLEYWAFEFLVLLAGRLPNSAKSTSLIAMCVNTEALTFNIIYGLSATVSTRVANEIGAGCIEQAKNAAAVSLKISSVLAVIVVLFLVFGSDVWASAFSDSPVIKKEFSSMAPWVAISVLFDAAQAILSGVARGCGWQHLGAYTNLGAFYLVGMPIAVVLGFKSPLQAKGLWIGAIFGIATQASLLVLITLRTKWGTVTLPLNNSSQMEHTHPPLE